MSIDRTLVDKLVADYEQLGKTISQIDALVPKDVVIKLKSGDNVQSALDSLSTTGGILDFTDGFYPGVLLLKYKNKLVIFRGKETTQLQGFNAGLRTGNVSFENLSFINPVTTAHVSLGGDKNLLNKVEDIPSGFTFRRIKFNGPTRRAIMANCADLLVDTCDARGYFVNGQDSQAICGWNGSRNHLIRDSHLEAASENILYGGADAASEEMYPRDIIIENNTFSKREEWKTQNYNMKCLLETKNIIGLTLRNNLFKGCWRQAWGNAPAIVLKSANQDGTNLTARTQDVLIENNQIEDVGSYLVIVGKDDGPFTSGVMKNIKVVNNLFRFMSAESDGRAVNISAGPENLLLDHNSMFDSRHSFVELFDLLAKNLKITNNIGFHGTYCIRPNIIALDDNTFSYNAIQSPTSGASVKLAPTNKYYPDVKGDLSAHATSDGKLVGSSL